MPTFLQLYNPADIQRAAQGAQAAQERNYLAVSPHLDLSAAARGASERFIEGSRLELERRRTDLAEDAYRYERRTAPFAIGIAATGAATSLLAQVRNRQLRRKNDERIASLLQAIDDFTRRPSGTYTNPNPESSLPRLYPAGIEAIPPEAIENTGQLEFALPRFTPAAPLQERDLAPGPAPAKAPTVFEEMVPQPQVGQLSPQTKAPYAFNPEDLLLYQDLR